MNATQKNIELHRRASYRGINLPLNDASTLRRAELALQRWAELECGDANESGSYGIERDETTGQPFMRHITNKKDFRYPIPDRESGALRRVAAICKLLGLHYFHQTDPRGCALYIASEPMTYSNYSSIGVSCGV